VPKNKAPQISPAALKSAEKLNHGGKNYWLVKSEKDVFSIEDLEKAPGKTTCWDGVRNYQARNYMRDSMKKGDLVFYYHSNSEPSAIAGIAEIVKEGYPDDTAFDPEDGHFDPKSKHDAPTWYMVSIKHVETFKTPLSLDMLKNVEGLEEMVLLQKGSRLSVQPVSEREWLAITKLAKSKKK
jgi:predicted RNA-binding protein with PUA-like domain